MPLEDDAPETQTYVYVQNNDPTNTSVAFQFSHDDGVTTVALGEEVELTAEQHAQLSPHFVLKPADEVEQEVVDQAAAPVEEAEARDAAETAADNPATGLHQSPWTDGSGEPTSDSGDNLGESQNASGSSKS